MRYSSWPWWSIPVGHSEVFQWTKQKYSHWPWWGIPVGHNGVFQWATQRYSSGSNRSIPVDHDGVFQWITDVLQWVTQMYSSGSNKYSSGSHWCIPVGHTEVFQWIKQKYSSGPWWGIPVDHRCITVDHTEVFQWIKQVFQWAMMRYSSGSHWCIPVGHTEVFLQIFQKYVNPPKQNRYDGSVFRDMTSPATEHRAIKRWCHLNTRPRQNSNTERTQTRHIARHAQCVDIAWTPPGNGPHIDEQQAKRDDRLASYQQRLISHVDTLVEVTVGEQYLTGHGRIGEWSQWAKPFLHRLQGNESGQVERTAGLVVCTCKFRRSVVQHIYVCICVRIISVQKVLKCKTPSYWLIDLDILPPTKPNTVWPSTSPAYNREKPS